MDLRLVPDLIRQWIAVQQSTIHMRHDLPPHFHEDWNGLPWNRYRIFYGVLVPVIIHHGLLRLHNMPQTRPIRKVMTAQALVTGLFDDLFDRIHLPTERIRKLMETPDYIISSEYIEEHLCQYLYRDIFEHFTGDSKILEDSIQAIMQAQDMSRKQEHPNLTTDEVLQITRKKGGNAVLFYRSCLKQSLTEEERDFLLEVGSLFQMTNDINDALKDQQAEETTLMTTGLTIREITEIFERQKNHTFQMWNSLPDNLYHKENFFNRINILIARSMVTLERYGLLSDPSVPFDIGNIPPTKIISGLMFPYEVGKWHKHYSTLALEVKTQNYNSPRE